MKFVKLTNTGRFRDEKIYINVDAIISIFEEATDGGSLRTVIFGNSVNPIRWVVEESVGEVLKKIKELENESP